MKGVTYQGQSKNNNYYINRKFKVTDLMSSRRAKTASLVLGTSLASPLVQAKPSKKIKFDHLDITSKTLKIQNQLIKKHSHLIPKQYREEIVGLMTVSKENYQCLEELTKLAAKEMKAKNLLRFREMEDIDINLKAQIMSVIDKVIYSNKIQIEKDGAEFLNATLSKNKSDHPHAKKSDCDLTSILETGIKEKLGFKFPLNAAIIPRHMYLTFKKSKLENSKDKNWEATCLLSPTDSANITTKKINFFSNQYYINGFKVSKRNIKKGFHMKALDHDEAISYYLSSMTASLYEKYQCQDFCLAMLDDVEKLNKKNLSLYSLRNKIYMRNGDFKKLISNSEKMLEAMPQNAKSYSTSGFANLFQAKVLDSSVDFYTAYKLDPSWFNTVCFFSPIAFFALLSTLITTTTLRFRAENLLGKASLSIKNSDLEKSLKYVNKLSKFSPIMKKEFRKDITKIKSELLLMQALEKEQSKNPSSEMDHILVHKIIESIEKLVIDLFKSSSSKNQITKKEMNEILKCLKISTNYKKDEQLYKAIKLIENYCSKYSNISDLHIIKSIMFLKNRQLDKSLKATDKALNVQQANSKSLINDEKLKFYCKIHGFIQSLIKPC